LIICILNTEEKIACGHESAGMRSKHGLGCRFTIFWEKRCNRRQKTNKIPRNRPKNRNFSNQFFHLRIL